MSGYVSWRCGFKSVWACECRCVSQLQASHEIVERLKRGSPVSTSVSILRTVRRMSVNVGGNDLTCVWHGLGNFRPYDIDKISHCNGLSLNRRCNGGACVCDSCCGRWLSLLGVNPNLGVDVLSVSGSGGSCR